MSEQANQYEDPRVKRTKQLIVDAFVSLLGEKDFDTITNCDIAERATVNRTTIYSHFDDKYKILGYMTVQETRKSLSAVVKLDAEFTRENLTLLTVAVCDYLANMQGHCENSFAHLGEYMKPHIQSVIYEFVFRWMSALDIDAVKRQTIATVVSASILGAAVQWLDGGMQQTPAEIAEGLMDILTTGIDIRSAGVITGN